MTRIKLKPIAQTDAKDFYNLAHSDELVPSPIAQFLPSYVQDFESTMEMVGEFVTQHNGRSLHYYMIRAENKSIGFISAEFSRVNPQGFYVTYFLGNKHRGHHYMIEALNLLFKRLEKYELPCIFEVDDSNSESRHIVESVLQARKIFSNESSGKIFHFYRFYP